MLSSALVTSLVFFAIYRTHYLANSVYNYFNSFCKLLLYPRDGEIKVIVPVGPV